MRTPALNLPEQRGQPGDTGVGVEMLYQGL